MTNPPAQDPPAQDPPAKDPPARDGAAAEAARRAEKRLARSAARLAAVQALYAMELTGDGWSAARDMFETHWAGVEIDGALFREPDRKLFRALLEGVVARQAEIDRLTDAALVERWALDRVDPVLRALFRCGGFELIGRPDTPFKVVINEYVDVAKAFFEGDEPGFANAVLDHMARRSRPEETARETARG